MNEIDQINKENYQGKSFRSWKNVLIKSHLDLPLALAILLLSLFGLIILYSAANQSSSQIIHQFLFILIGFVVMVLMAHIPPRYYQAIAPILFALVLLMLLAVLGLGIISKGAQRWIGAGGLRFQPSELMKIALPMMLAWYLRNKTLPPTLSTIFFSCLIIFIPALLIAKQPDLGTALLVAGTGVFVLLLSGMRTRVILIISILISACLPIIWHFMHAYQKIRIWTFFNPENDPLGAGYHIIQSKIAIGSGGFFGKGYLKGTQIHLQFLPEHTTDFIFAVLGEEFGFMGCVIVLALMIFILIRMIAISIETKDTFTRLLAGGLSMIFFLAFFVNVSMVIGIMPVVGVPLPLISYGGSSIITLMVMFGIVMSIHSHQKLL